MRLQMRLLLKGFITIKTCVFSNVRVHQHVLTKESLGSEYLKADGAADVRPAENDRLRYDGQCGGGRGRVRGGAGN